VRWDYNPTNSGWWFGTFFFHLIYGMSSFPLTNPYFSRWLKTTSQIYIRDINGTFMGKI
jgi:hypothetical protein